MLVAVVAAGVLQAALTPLSVKELTGLLDGVLLQRGDIELVSGRQYFYPDGRYLVPSRVVLHGSWRVAPGRLCHRLQGEGAVEQCVSVATDGRGRFYAAETDAALAQGQTYEIRFVPVPTRR